MGKEEEDIYGEYEEASSMQEEEKQGESFSDGETKPVNVTQRDVESSSDEDDVSVVLEPSSAYYSGETSTVGDSKGLFVSGTTRHWQRPGYSSSGEGVMVGSGGGYSRGGVDLSLLPKPPADFSGAHVDYSVFENEIDSLEEKPWREKGAELSDYFNYGFTEDTWREYCRRQQVMRLYSQSLMPIRTLDSSGPFQNADSSGGGEPSRKVARGGQNRRFYSQQQQQQQQHQYYPSLKSNFIDTKVYNDANDSFDYLPYSKHQPNDGDDVVLTLTKPNVDDS